ncbi:GNAT family N-acetyltransferase [Sporosarcina aquimarina]|uniref:GNAT family N-acetyltransferase n=1 Tax=Sporosarcina aquimarina TaxID=114975 RepID=UPI0020421BED|nr:GNAT family protein [Sporosarcina aquimarina]MCM3759009.1 GNAT family N-acetyltransferase [Sporosarcina aquimarina]
MKEEFPIIETERLLLREVQKEDSTDMLSYLSDKDVVKHMGLNPFHTVKEAEEEIEWYQQIYKDSTGIRWGISLKDNGRVIGSCGFLNRQPKHFRTEIGYELSKEYWGKGIASEALEAVVKYGFQHLQLERIEALIEPANVASLKLLTKNGFEKEGLLRHYEFTCGKFDDLYMYSILKGDVVTT